MNPSPIDSSTTPSAPFPPRPGIAKFSCALPTLPVPDSLDHRPIYASIMIYALASSFLTMLPILLTLLLNLSKSRGSARGTAPCGLT